MDLLYIKLVVVIILIVICITIFKKLQIPTILSYITIGVLIGPHGIKLLHYDTQLIHIAEFGLVFLLFTIGLELPITKLFAMRYTLFLMGGCQVFLCTSIVAMVLLYFQLSSVPVALLVGIILALSSTAIVSKQLSEQNELHSNVGYTSFSMLIFQDLAAVPFLILVPVLSSTLGAGQSHLISYVLFMVLLKGIIVFGVITFIGHYILPSFFNLVARMHSNELFMFAVLMVSLSAALIAHVLNLSMAFGAFLAGIALGESRYRHQIEADIRPFRDILLGLFFITIGVMLRLDLVWHYWVLILYLVVIFVALKFAIIMLMTYLMSKRPLWNESIRVALILSHGGEFGFALLTLAQKKPIFSDLFAQILLTVLVMSMIAGVFLIKNSYRITQIFNLFYKDNTKIPETTLMQNKEETYNNHIIICGFGRVGRNLSKFLTEEKQKYIALDTNVDSILSSNLNGYTVFYGDATRTDVLELAGVLQARMAVVCIDNINVTEQIILAIRQINNKIPVLVRARDDSNYECLQNAGASEIIAETLEASMMLVMHVLMLLNIKPKRILAILEQARHNRYQILKDFFTKTEDV